MKALTLAIVVLLLGCLSSPTENPTTSTLKTITLAEASTIAKQYLLESAEYGISKCQGLALNESGQISCPGCWRLVFIYRCNVSLERPGVSIMRKAELFVQDARVSSNVESDVGRTCSQDGDCIPERPAANTAYLCRLGMCSTGAFTKEAELYCISRGNQLVARRQPTGETYTVCQFTGGSECEAEAYRRQRCGWNTSNLTDCGGFTGGQICPQSYSPVCAKVRTGASQPYLSHWRTFNNPCTACTYGTRDDATVGYVMGTCTSTTSTTNPGGLMNAAARFCENNGFVYKLRQRASGREYGVCYFGVEDECDAEEYFAGKCKPQSRL